MFPTREIGNTEEDWEIFDVLCEDFMSPPPPCSDHPAEHLSHHTLDLVTSLRSELAAISYKRDRLMTELTEAKNALCTKESECETLRAQTARQTALINSLQSRLQAAETREHNVQARCDSTIDTIQREKRSVDEKNKELMQTVRRLEIDLANEESHKEQAKAQLHELVRKLCCCLGLDACENVQLSPDCVVGKAGEVVAELQRLRTKLASTCEALTGCENELLNSKSSAAVEKQRLTSQIEGLQGHNHDLDARCRQTERDLQVTRDRLAECELNGEKLREELRGFESRCHRLQNTMDRFQNDRMTFLRTLAGLVNATEPCETLVKDRVREILSENQTMHTQIHNLREQLNTETSRHKETHDTLHCRIRNEETEKCALEEDLKKAQQEIHDLRREHQTLAEYLVRLSRALCWGECTAPPAPGSDTTILAESLLDRAERITAHHEHHTRGCDKNCWDHHPHTHPHGHHHHPVPGNKIRRERSCHDIPLKESSAMYTLQRRVRVLREQVQRRDLHLELLRRKIALLEEGARGKCHLQAERDEAVNRLKRAQKQSEKLSQQLVETKTQLAEVKGSLAEAVEHKIAALERAKKIEELSARICELENENSRLQAQVCSLKDRIRASTESSQERRCRDEVLINSLKDDISRLQTQLADANHRLSHLQQFRTSVARTLHLRDIPESDLLHRLQTLCNAHQEFTLLSRRYESVSPIAEHSCPRYEDLVPPSAQCRPISASSPIHHHHSTNHVEHPVGRSHGSHADHGRINGNHGSNHGGHSTQGRHDRGRRENHDRHDGVRAGHTSNNGHGGHNCRYEDSSNYNDDHFDSDFEFTKKY